MYGNNAGVLRSYMYFTPVRPVQKNNYPHVCILPLVSKLYVYIVVEKNCIYVTSKIYKFELPSFFIGKILME